MKKVIIVGAGMAGSEAAWQVAQRGIKVDLYKDIFSKPLLANIREFSIKRSLQTFFY